jgi:hypothetical protein
MFIVKWSFASTDQADRSGIATLKCSGKSVSIPLADVDHMHLLSDFLYFATDEVRRAEIKRIRIVFDAHAFRASQ